MSGKWSQRKYPWNLVKILAKLQSATPKPVSLIHCNRKVNLRIVFLFNFGKLEFTFCLLLGLIGDMVGLTDQWKEGIFPQMPLLLFLWKCQGFYANTKCFPQIPLLFPRKCQGLCSSSIFHLATPASPLTESICLTGLPDLPLYFCSLFQCFNVNLPHWPGFVFVFRQKCMYHKIGIPWYSRSDDIFRHQSNSRKDVW